MDVRVELLTGSVKGKKREAILEGFADGGCSDTYRYACRLEDTVGFLLWEWWL